MTATPTRAGRRGELRIPDGRREARCARCGAGIVWGGDKRPVALAADTIQIRGLSRYALPHRCGWAQQPLVEEPAAAADTPIDTSTPAGQMLARYQEARAAWVQATGAPAMAFWILWRRPVGQGRPDTDIDHAAEAARLAALHQEID